MKSEFIKPTNASQIGGNVLVPEALGELTALPQTPLAAMVYGLPTSSLHQPDYFSTACFLQACIILLPFSSPHYSPPLFIPSLFPSPFHPLIIPLPFSSPSPFHLLIIPLHFPSLHYSLPFPSPAHLAPSPSPPLPFSPHYPPPPFPPQVTCCN